MCRYVVLNPVRAGIVTQARQGSWGSYGATAGFRKAPPPLLVIDWVLAQFGRRSQAAQKAYRQFVREGVGEESPMQALRGGFLLGSALFVEQCMAYIEEDKPLYGIPQYELHVNRPEIESLFDEAVLSDKARRNAAMVAAHREHRYTLREIGEVVGLSIGMVSRIVRKKSGVSK